MIPFIAIDDTRKTQKSEDAKLPADDAMVVRDSNSS